MLKNDTLKNGTSRISLYGSALPPPLGLSITQFPGSAQFSPYRAQKVVPRTLSDSSLETLSKKRQSKNDAVAMDIQPASIPFEQKFSYWPPRLLDRLSLLKVPIARIVVLRYDSSFAIMCAITLRSVL